MSGQVNCEAIYEKDSPEYCACMLMYGDIGNNPAIYQGSKAHQELCDSAISLFPSFADAYYIKAIPFLKRGEFKIWNSLINKAVEFDSLTYLGYRGGAQFMFLRNYEEAIKDIERLMTFIDDDLGTIYNGEYDLQVIRALSYKGLGDTGKAISIMEEHMDKSHSRGLFDFYHLGVMYFEQNDFFNAEKYLLKQVNDVEIADAYYYLALIYKKSINISDSKSAINKVHDLYMNGRTMRGNDSYMDYPDKVYLEQVMDLVRSIENRSEERIRIF